MEARVFSVLIISLQLLIQRWEFIITWQRALLVPRQFRLPVRLHHEALVSKCCSAISETEIEKRVGGGGVRVGGGGLNESYSYAFSFTSIRIHNWEAGEGDRREEFSRVEWRHTPACIQNSPYTEGCRWHHCTYVTLLMTSLAHSLSSVAFKAFFPSHAQLPPTHKYLPAVTVWVLCTFSG